MSRPECKLRKAVAPVLEKLEQRQLLSVSLVDGVLDIEGTNSNDVIVVAWANGSRGLLKVELNGQINVIADRVSKINIEAGSGDDSVTIYELGGKINTPTTVWGERGNDSIITGSGNDTVYGGKGENQIDAGAGKNTVSGVVQPMAATTSSGAVFKPYVAIPSYVITDLGTLPNKAGATWVRNLNQSMTPSVVGYVVINDSGRQVVRHAFRRGAGGTLDLGTFSNTSGSVSEAWDINTSGRFVGNSNSGIGTSYNGYYYDGSRMVNVGTAGGGDTFAYGMNRQYTEPIWPWIPPAPPIAPQPGRPYPQPDIVVGVTGAGAPAGNVTDGTRRSGLAYWYRVGQSMAILPDPGATGSGGVLRGEAREVNNRYQIVGWNARTNFAFVLTDVDLPNGVNPGPVSYSDLGSLNGGPSEAFDINDPPSAATPARVVGTSDIGLNLQRAFWWQGTTMQALPQPNQSVTWAWGLNDADYVVGYVETRSGATATRQAALWVPTSATAYQFINLQALTSGATGRVLMEAKAINNEGVIIATGTVPGDTAIHSFLLRPGPSGGMAFSPEVFSSVFTTGLPNGGAAGRLTYNIFGGGDYVVGKSTVTVNFLSTDLEKGRLPSEGVVDFTFGAPMVRRILSVTKGTGIFEGRATAQITANDGTFADILVRFEGTTYRKNKRDFIEGTITGISRRGKVLMQGRYPIFSAKFGPR